MGSFEGMTKMEDLYEQHLVTQQIHKTAHKNFNYNPWSSKVLAGMAERLLRPNVGMRWDVTIIDKKTDGEINADGKEDDRRQRANSAGGIFSALRLRSSTHSTVSTTKTPPPQKKSAMKAQGGERGLGGRRHCHGGEQEKFLAEVDGRHVLGKTRPDQSGVESTQRRQRTERRN